MRRAGRVALLVAALGASAAGCRKPVEPKPKPQSSASPCVPVVLVAKRGTPAIDGKLDQPVWHDASATAPFVELGRDRPVPHTEARASWDDGSLYLALYVADDDLRSTDRVRIEFDGGRSLEASPDLELRCRFGNDRDCTTLGIRAGFDVDGDVDATAEEDEEWAVTLAIPWRSFASSGRPTELTTSFRRDDSVGGHPLVTVWSRGCGVIRFE